MTEHRVQIDMADEDDRYSWECSCGHGGSGPGDFLRAEIHSDRHINRESGSTRIDTHPGRR